MQSYNMLILLDSDSWIVFYREQFNLLRVVDNKKYPAFFEYKNKRYRLEVYEESVGK